MNRKPLAWIAAFALSLPLAAQTATQDMKNAGTDTKQAATSAGHGVSKGSKTAYHKTVNGTKTGYHKTVHATKTGVHKVEGKPNTPANNPPQ
jgi:hypothetical protein